MLGMQTLCLTNRCNLACTYCWYQTGLATYPQALLTARDYDEWFTTCGQIEPLEVAFLSGGEPTLRGDFVQILTTVHSHFPSVVVLSNGVDIEPELCAQLAERGTVVHISLDHVSSGIPDRVRGGTNRTLASLERLSALGVPMQVTYVMTARNHTDLALVVEYCRSRGIALEINVVAVPRMHPLAVPALPEDLRRQIVAVIEEAADLLKRPAYYAGLARYLVTGRLRPVSRCRAATSSVFIESDGAVFLCGQRRTGADALGRITAFDPASILAAHASAVRQRPAGPCVSLNCLTVA